jgi:transketolase
LGSSILQSAGHHGIPQAAGGAEACLAELDAQAAALGVADADDSAVAVLTAPDPLAVNRRPRIQAGTLDGAVEAAGMAQILEQGVLSTCRAYGAALMSIGADPRVVATDADVKDATCADMFARQFPDRYFEAGIAEQNMVAMAVGLAAAGRIPFASTLARFFDRAYDQVEMAATSNANVKLVGSHAGVSLARGGAGQMGVGDLGLFRALAHARSADGTPACRVFLPSDAMSAFKLTELMANVDGLCYMRTHAPDVSIIYGEEETFREGGHKHLVDGTDLAIVTSGYMVHVVREAIALMEADGLEPSVIDVYSLPLAMPDEILRVGDDCNGQILVVEDNYIGGVSDEIAAAAAASDMGVTVSRMVVESVGRGARTTDEILQAFALSARHIADAAQAIFDQVQ